MLKFMVGSPSDRKLRLFARACCGAVEHLLNDERSRRAIEAVARYAEVAPRWGDNREIWAEALMAAEAIVRSPHLDKGCAALAAALTVHPRRPWPVLVAALTAAAVVAEHGEGRAAVVLLRAIHAEMRALPGARLRLGDRLVLLGAALTDGMSGLGRRRLALEVGAWDAAAEALTSLETVMPALFPEHDHESSRAARRAQAGLLRDLLGNPWRPVTLCSLWLTPDVVAVARAVSEHRGRPGGTLDPLGLAILADALDEAGCTEASILDHLRDPGPHVPGCWAVDLLLGRT
jgi:hypothetical protein